MIPELPARAIPVRSRSQAMEWSLALASQEIFATIVPTDNGWALQVEGDDMARALVTLRQYHLENRGWPLRQEVPGTRVLFDWSSLFWAAGLGAFYYASAVRQPVWKVWGRVDSSAIWAGQWWRLFTAITLHADLGHLAGNVLLGTVLLGLAMAYDGPGLALLAAFLSGALGNLAAAALDPKFHLSLGASGMVTGALGLVTVLDCQTIDPNGRLKFRFSPRAVAGGVLILVLIGFSPEADLSAHAGGFASGILLGLILGKVPRRIKQNRSTNAIAATLVAAILTAAWLSAIHHGSM